MPTRRRDREPERDSTLLRHPESSKQGAVGGVDAGEAFVEDEGDARGTVAGEQEGGERSGGARATDFFVEALSRG